MVFEDLDLESWFIYGKIWSTGVAVWLGSGLIKVRRTFLILKNCFFRALLCTEGLIDSLSTIQDDCFCRVHSERIEIWRLKIKTKHLPAPVLPVFLSLLHQLMYLVKRLQEESSPARPHSINSTRLTWGSFLEEEWPGTTSLILCFTAVIQTVRKCVLWLKKKRIIAHTYLHACTPVLLSFFSSH